MCIQIPTFTAPTVEILQERLLLLPTDSVCLRPFHLLEPRVKLVRHSYSYIIIMQFRRSPHNTIARPVQHHPKIHPVSIMRNNSERASGAEGRYYACKLPPKVFLSPVPNLIDDDHGNEGDNLTSKFLKITSAANNSNMHLQKQKNTSHCCHAPEN